MDRNTKIIVGSASSLVLGLTGYFVIKNKKKRAILKQQEMQNQNPSLNQSTNNTVKQTAIITDFPLQNGSRGENVKQLQAFLNQKYNVGLVVDGIFGDNTAKAVKKLTGSTLVSETQFRQYIGTPMSASASTGVNQGQPKNKLLSALSLINPAFKIFN
jgi:peptidoglycan hydrolase-like protein with peptidoglycan-binding domain